MKLTMKIFKKLIRESLEELEQGNRSELDSFGKVQASRWSDADLRQEFDEEVADLSGDDYNMSREEYIAQRWPYVNISTLDFMQDSEAFVAKARMSPIVYLPISEIKKIHNHGQVHEVIKMFERGASSKEVKGAMFDFFSPHETAADARGQTYNKAQSYLRWVGEFEKPNLVFNKPPILLNAGGRLMHIGGQTRQVGALTNRKVLPYLILNADNS